MNNWKGMLGITAFFWVVCFGGYLLILWLFSADPISRFDLGYGALSALAISAVIAWTSDKRQAENDARKAKPKTKKNHKR